MKTKNILSGLLLAGFIQLAAIGQATASIASYEFTLTIQTVDYYFPPCSSTTPGFGCLSAGDTFSGSFSVDSSILSVDGIVNDAILHDFRLSFGNAFFSTGSDNQDLGGFVNGLGLAGTLGFLIEGGEIVDLVGGITGDPDIPYIDFYNPLFTHDPRNFFYASDVYTGAYGGLAINRTHPVPEPAPLMLIGLGLATLAIFRQRCSRRRAQPI